MGFGYPGPCEVWWQHHSKLSGFSSQCDKENRGNLSRGAPWHAGPFMKLPWKQHGRNSSEDLYMTFYDPERIQVSLMSPIHQNPIYWGTSLSMVSLLNLPKLLKCPKLISLFFLFLKSVDILIDVLKVFLEDCQSQISNFLGSCHSPMIPILLLSGLHFIFLLKNSSPFPWSFITNAFITQNEKWSITLHNVRSSLRYFN